MVNEDVLPNDFKIKWLYVIKNANTFHTLVGVYFSILQCVFGFYNRWHIPRSPPWPKFSLANFTKALDVLFSQMRKMNDESYLEATFPKTFFCKNSNFVWRVKRPWAKMSVVRKSSQIHNSFTFGTSQNTTSLINLSLFFQATTLGRSCQTLLRRFQSHSRRIWTCPSSFRNELQRFPLWSQKSAKRAISLCGCYNPNW